MISCRRGLRNTLLVGGLLAVACGGRVTDTNSNSDTNEVTGQVSEALSSTVYASPKTTCLALGVTPDVSCVDTSNSGFAFVPLSKLLGETASDLGSLVKGVNDIVGAVANLYGAFQAAQALLQAFDIINTPDPNAEVLQRLDQLSAHVDAVAGALQYNLQDMYRTGRLNTLTTSTLDLQGVAKNVWPVACNSRVAPCQPLQKDYNYWDTWDDTWSQQVNDGASDPAFHRLYDDSRTNGASATGSFGSFTWKDVITYTKSDLLPDASGNNVYDWRVPLPALLQLEAVRLALFASEDPKFQHDRWSRFGPQLKRMHDDLLRHLYILEGGLKCNTVPSSFVTQGGGRQPPPPVVTYYSKIACADIFTGLNETAALLCGAAPCDAASVKTLEKKAYIDVRGMTPWFQVQAMVDTLYLFENAVSDLTYWSSNIEAANAPPYPQEPGLCLDAIGEGNATLSNCIPPAKPAQPWAYDRTQQTLVYGPNTVKLCLDAGPGDVGQSVVVAPCNSPCYTDPASNKTQCSPVPSQRWTWDPEHLVLHNATGNALEIPSVHVDQHGALAGAAAGQLLIMNISADLGDPQKGGLGPDLQLWGAVPWFPPQRWRGANPHFAAVKTKNWLTSADTIVSGSTSVIRTSSLTVAADGAAYYRSQQNGLFQDPAAITSAGFAPPGAATAGGRQTATQFDAFVVANDGKLYMMAATNGGPFQAPTPLTAGGFAPPGAALATAAQGGQLGVAVVDNTGALKINWWNPVFGWLGPVAVTGANYAPPGAAVTVGMRASGELDTFSIGSDGALKYMAFYGGLWTGPWALTLGNFAPPGAPVATANDVHGYLNVFTIGNDGALYTKWDCTALWCGATALTATGFVPAGGYVSAINFSNGSLNAFVVDQTGTIDVLSNAGLSWHGPSAVSNPNTSVPGAATSASLEGSSQLDLFAVSTAGRFLETVNVGGSWTAPMTFE
jgi:hypothetical protein